MDFFTALSGSGPAYFLYFFEALIESGVRFGLNKKIIKSFILQTAAGTLSLSLAYKDSLSLKELRKKTTSPNGTTAAAISIFEQKLFKKIIHEAIEAAIKRASQLVVDK